MAEFRQTSFAAGELSPTMWGRTDLQQYEHGLRRAHNFVIDQHGGAVFRPGFRHVARCAPGSNVRLCPLVVSASESYLLVFTASKVRIHPSGGESFTELETTYSDLDVPRLRFQQLGRGVLVFCPGKPIQEIRGSGSTWARTTFTADPEFSAASVGLEPIWAYRGPVGKTPTEIMRTSDGSYTAPRAEDRKYRYVFAYSVVYFHPATGTYVETTPNNFTLHGDNANGSSKALRDAGGDLYWPRGNPWMEAGLPIFERIDPDNFPVRQIYLVRNRFYTPPAGYEHHSIRFFRGTVGPANTAHPGFRDGTAWGLVAETTQDPSLEDIVVEFNYFTDPDYAQPPRFAQSDLYDYRGTTAVTAHNPTVGALHDQRLVLASSTEAPDKLWFSQVNSFDNFDLYPLPAAHHALTAELGSRTLERIRALVSHHKLLVLTDTNLWALDGADGGPIATGNITARIYAEVGAAPIDPLVLGPDVFFVSADRRRIFRARYDGRSQMYDAEEVSLTSSHFFGKDILAVVRSWAATKESSYTVWMAKDDGTFVTMTYAPEIGVLAFTGHATAEGDHVLDFATLRVGGEDRIYAAVRRRVSGAYETFLERVDSAYRLDGFSTHPHLGGLGNREHTITGLERLNGRVVQVVASAGGPQVVLGPYTVQDGKVTFTVPTLPGETEETLGYTFGVGLPYVGELELLDFPVEKLRVKTISRVGWEVEGSRGLLTGEDFDHLYEWRQTTIADVYGPAPATGLAEVVIGSTWNKHGRAVLRQPLPLPLTVLGVTREGKLGG